MKLHRYSVNMGETGLLVKSDKGGVEDRVTGAVSEAREDILSHFERFPDFRWSLEPVERPDVPMPWFIGSMYDAGRLAEVGPFASIAGVLAHVAALAAVEAGASSVIVENGGDLCIHGVGPFTVGIFAGDSPFSSMGFRVTPGGSFAGLCTSSGTVGNSISLGDADAVVAFTPDSPAVADALATSVCNEVRGTDGIQRGIEKAKRLGIGGVAIISGERMGAWGVLPDMVEVDRDGKDLVLDSEVHSRA
jgi:ApbE superfamily uncharacterized protein (UPF0280 family)